MVSILAPLVKNMKKHLVLGMAFGIALSVASLHGANTEKPEQAEEKTQAEGEADDNGYSQISILAKAVELLRQDYVDGNKTLDTLSFKSDQCISHKILMNRSLNPNPRLRP